MNSILFVGEHARTYKVHWHTHDYWELVYCTGGEGEFQFQDGSTISYTAGDAVAIPPHVTHCNFSKDSFTNIHLTMDSPSFPFRGAFQVSDDGEDHLKTAFSQAKFYYISDIKHRELMLSAFGDLISGYMLVFRSNSGFSPAVDELRTAIINGYCQPDFALDDTIRSMPFHYDYLRKLFKKEMGTTPLEYLTGLRMKKAELMLSAMWTREYSVGEVAMECGYDNALYFSRVFRKHFGCAPSQFAKERGAAGKTE